MGAFFFYQGRVMYHGCMIRVLKWLVLADVCMLALIALIVYATRNSNDFSILWAVYPLVAMMFLTVAILVLLYIKALRSASTRSAAKSSSTLIVSIIVLLGVPGLGYYYATHGQNRESLHTLSVITFIIGLIASTALIARFIRSRPNY
jgi:hypothetical protein